MGIVLDTTILIAAEKGQLDLAAFWSANSEEPIFLAAITVSELLHGVERATPSRRAKRALYVEGVLSAIEVLDFDAAVARRHASIWATLESAGNMIGAHDLLIAATALHHGFTVATLNTKDFVRVAGIQLVYFGAPPPKP